jgi:hypothetical protein
MRMVMILIMTISKIKKKIVEVITNIMIKHNSCTFCMKVDTAPFMQLDKILFDITKSRMKIVFIIKPDIFFRCEDSQGKEPSLYVFKQREILKWYTQFAGCNWYTRACTWTNQIPLYPGNLCKLPCDTIVQFCALLANIFFPLPRNNPMWWETINFGWKLSPFSSTLNPHIPLR